MVRVMKEIIRIPIDFPYGKDVIILPATFDSSSINLYFYVFRIDLIFWLLPMM